MDHRNSSQPLMPEGQAMLSGPAREALREAAMALDIAALHSMYGTKAFNTTNTTYTLTDAGSAVLDITGPTISIGEAFYSIWDTAGMRKKARVVEKLEKLSVADGLRDHYVLQRRRPTDADPLLLAR